MKHNKKLFKVSFRSDYGHEVYIIANGFDEASEKGTEARILIDNEENSGSILDKDGSLKNMKIFQVDRIELLTENFIIS